MFQGPRGLLFSLLATAAVIAAAFTFGFEGGRDDADTARAFLTHMAAGEQPEAYTLLHADITERQSPKDLAALLEGMEPFTQILFPKVSFNNTNGINTTRLSGTGTTPSGCQSALSFDLLNGAITFVAVHPVCRGTATDA